MTDFDQLHFTAEHEWVRLDETTDGAAPSATIGITAYAANKLGDVVYVDLPDAGAEIADGAVVGEIESTKSVGELFAPVDGTVLEKNAAVEDNPELVNSDPYGEGWLIRIEYTELKALLTRAEYQALLGDEAESDQ